MVDLRKWIDTAPEFGAARTRVTAARSPAEMDFSHSMGALYENGSVQHLNDELTGPGLDDVGVTFYESSEQIDDAALLDDIVSEFLPVRLPAAHAAGITRA